MRKLVVEEWISLDGFISGKNGEMDFFTQMSPEENSFSDREQLHFLESVDCIILGRKTYELFVDYWPTKSADSEIIADRLNAIPKFVVSSTLNEAPWGKWPAATVIHKDAQDAIKEIKSEPGKDIIMWGSISLTQALMKAGLVDELRLQVCPVLLGEGRKLFTGEYQGRLTLLHQREYPTGIALLNYSVDQASQTSL